MNTLKLNSSSASNTPPTKSLADVVEEVRRLMAKTGRILFKSKPYVVHFPDDSRVLLLISRHTFTDSWEVKVEKKQSCPECGREAEAIEIKEVDSEGLAEWLERVSQRHGFHGQPLSINEVHELPADTQGVKVLSPSEPAGPRIKVTTMIADAQPAGGALQVTHKKSIKVRDASYKVVSTDAPPTESGPAETRKAEGASLNEPSPVFFDYQLPSGDSVYVIIPLHVCKALFEHCRQSLRHEREVGGVLIGEREQKVLSGAVTHRVWITDLIEFRASDSSGAHLHLDHASWAYVYQKETERGFEEEKKTRLGWYHTHPTQGIFFSNQDHDFHTVFTLPYQFALVVDPQKMEVGLFYWTDWELRRLVGPQCRMLRRESETSAPPASADPPAVETSRTEERNSPSVLRFLIGFVALLAVLGHSFVNSTGYLLRPEQVFLIALVVLLEFRLWNMGWFHPRAPVESTALKWVEKCADASVKFAGGPVLGGLKRVPGKMYLALIAFVLLIVLALSVAIMIPRLGLRFPVVRNANSKERGVTQGIDQRDVNLFGERNLSEVRITIREDFRSAQPRLVLESGNNSDRLAVEYRPRRNGGGWECDSLSEQAFFRQLFQWDIREGFYRDYIAELQRSVAPNNPVGVVSPDGMWGRTTRNNFLIKALVSAETGAALEVLRPGGNRVKVTFER